MKANPMRAPVSGSIITSGCDRADNHRTNGLAQATMTAMIGSEIAKTIAAKPIASSTDGGGWDHPAQTVIRTAATNAADTAASRAAANP
ncbi:hypothetical protein GCM10007925_25000 [Sphingomonas astaxanthinifaciens DSM 22298]|uniref:Lipoprotein n=1 Tax=Sphingomonas astaxanthinifaciens DSM 22298 TaxID=1123267 RepID=A0ABQ5ZAT5_9SPHN|nr:hypothetical protein GCM10007925_25000 [Sphingomonas astaxanthinifaciens DSM 22298]